MPVQLGTDISASQRVTTALTNGAATATPATPLDLGPQGGRNQPFLGLQITAPAVANLANAGTVVYGVTSCATPGGSYAAAPGFSNILTQTGAGGVGAAANSVILRMPNETLQFVKVTAIQTGTGDHSAVSYIMEAVLDFNG